MHVIKRETQEKFSAIQKVIRIDTTFRHVPNLVNSVDILAERHVKEGIETRRFRASNL